jgi:hypothetical protein
MMKQEKALNNALAFAISKTIPLGVLVAKRAADESTLPAVIARE